MHIVIARAPGFAHIGGQVRRADKHPVDSLDRQDIIERGNPCPRFDLNQKADLVGGTVQIVAHPAIVRRSRQRRADAAHTNRGITARSHQFARLFAAFDHRHQQRHDTDVEMLLDHHAVI